MEIGKINLTKYVFQTGLFSDITGTVSRFSNEFQLNKVRVLYYQINRNKGTDQLFVHCTADMHIVCI